MSYPSKNANFFPLLSCACVNLAKENEKCYFCNFEQQKIWDRLRFSQSFVLIFSPRNKISHFFRLSTRHGHFVFFSWEKNWFVKHLSPQAGRKSPFATPVLATENLEGSRALADILYWPASTCKTTHNLFFEKLKKYSQTLHKSILASSPIIKETGPRTSPPNLKKTVCFVEL